MGTSRTAASRLTTAATTLLALALFTTTHLLERAGHRRSDKGYSLETVVITAGLVVIAIGIVAWIGPVVQRYLTQIQ